MFVLKVAFYSELNEGKKNVNHGVTLRWSTAVQAAEEVTSLLFIQHGSVREVLCWGERESSGVFFIESCH